MTVLAEIVKMAEIVKNGRNPSLNDFPNKRGPETPHEADHVYGFWTHLEGQKPKNGVFRPLWRVKNHQKRGGYFDLWRVVQDRVLAGRRPSRKSKMPDPLAGSCSQVHTQWHQPSMVYHGHHAGTVDKAPQAPCMGMYGVPTGSIQGPHGSNNGFSGSSRVK